MKNRHSSTLAFLDFLFNLVLAFVCLVILLLLQVKSTDSTHKAPPNENEFIVHVQWDDSTDDDVDLWARDPIGNVVGFLHREAPGMFLQKDDLGRVRKLITAADGTITEEKANFEMVNIVKAIPGRYTFNLQLYRADKVKYDKDLGSEITVRVRVTKINPYHELAPMLVKIKRDMDISAEITAISVELNAKGEIIATDNLPIKFVLSNIESIVNLPFTPN